MEFYYPHQFKRRNDEHEMVSMITNAKSTKNKKITITLDDIKSMMQVYLSSIIILLYDSNVKRNIYDEIILRLCVKCVNHIVVVAKINIMMNEIDTQYFIMNVLNQLKIDCMVKFRIKISVSHITLIGHKLSSNYLLNTTFTDSKNKIILIDPVLSTSSISQIDNIYIIVFSTSSYDSIMRQKKRTSTSNIYTLQDTDPSMIFASPTSIISLVNLRSDHTMRLVNSINGIINEN
jgi:hypothetical protein